MTKSRTPLMMRLDLFENDGFSRGTPRLVQIVWIATSGLLFNTWLPGSAWRRALLRAFGARIGRGVVIKPHVSIKFPWRLFVGDHVWIGESVWIDNLAQVTIGPHSCISQGAYLCTGSHDWTDLRFSLITRGISIGASCWVGARASVAPGTTMEDGSVIAMHGLARGRLKASMIYNLDGSSKTRLHTIGTQVFPKRNEPMA